MILRGLAAVVVCLGISGCSTLGTGRTSPPSPVLGKNSLSWPLPTIPSWEGQVLVHLDRGGEWGVPGAFLTRWGEAWAQINSGAPDYRRLYLLQKIYQESQEPWERFWAALGVFQIYKKSHLIDGALTWLSLARGLGDSPLLTLEQAWLVNFEKDDRGGALTLVRGLNRSLFSGQARERWNFLDQALHFSWLDRKDWGMDENISDLEVDHDDLWISTWNGALGRLSLASGEFTLLLKPSTAVAPIRFIRISRYFVYVFRDAQIQRYSKVTQNWKNFSLPPDLPGLRLQDVKLTGEDSFFAAHLGRGLWEWKAGQWIDRSAELTSLFLNVIIPGTDGTWLVGTQDQGILTWSPGTPSTPWAGTGRLNVTFLRKVGEGLLVGTFGQGLWLWQSSGGQKVSPVAYTTAVTATTGPLWWGTLDQGLHRGWGPGETSWQVAAGFSPRDVTALASWEGKVFMAVPGQGVGVWTDEN